MLDRITKHTKRDHAYEAANAAWARTPKHIKDWVEQHRRECQKYLRELPRRHEAHLTWLEKMRRWGFFA